MHLHTHLPACTGSYLPAPYTRPPAPSLWCSQQLDKLRGEVRAIVCTPKHCLPFLQPGRLVRVLPPEQEAAAAGAAGADTAAAAAAAEGRGGSTGVLGVVVNFERVSGRKQQAQQEGEMDGGVASNGGSKGAQYLVDVLCNCSEASLRHHGATKR